MDASEAANWLRSLPSLTGSAPRLDLESVPDDPVALFLSWIGDAAERAVPEPHAATLATVDADGGPDARTLILKDVSERGWAVAGQRSSRKGAQLAVQPTAALNFWWQPVMRAVRVRGVATEASRAESDADLAARSAAARAGIMPKDWVLWRIEPTRIEFWQGSPDRRHTRIVYTSDNSNWSREIHNGLTHEPVHDEPRAPRKGSHTGRQRMSRQADGSAGDADYGTIGRQYTSYRQPDPRIFAHIMAALGDARTIINVGAGAGSYEPTDRIVTPIEPSASMRAQRPNTLASAVDATAEDLPFDDDTFDAALASFTVHQWQNLPAGISELRRVTTGPIVILTCDPEALDRFWLNDYAPEVITTEASRYPHPRTITDLLGGSVDISTVPIPLDCTDGFGEAYYGRPEALLDPGARRANSAWSFVSPGVHNRCETTLGTDLTTGTWDAAHGKLRTQATFEGSLRLIRSKT